LPYTLRIDRSTESEKETYWTAEYIELSGCKIDGESEVDAVANLQELFDDYISTMIANNQAIPVPKHEHVHVWPMLVTTTLPLDQRIPSSVNEQTQAFWEEVKEIRVTRQDKKSVTYDEIAV